LYRPLTTLNSVGLAGAVGTDDAADLAGLDGQRDVVQRPESAEPHADVADLEDRSGGPGADPGPGLTCSVLRSLGWLHARTLDLILLERLK